MMGQTNNDCRFQIFISTYLPHQQSNVCLWEDEIQDWGMYLFTISFGSYAVDQRSRAKIFFLHGIKWGEHSQIKSLPAEPTSSVASDPWWRSLRLGEVTQTRLLQGVPHHRTLAAHDAPTTRKRRPGCCASQERTPICASKTDALWFSKVQGWRGVLALASRRMNVCVSTEKRPPISPARTTSFARPLPPELTG